MDAQAPGATFPTFDTFDAFRAPSLTLSVLAYFCPIELVAIVFDDFLNCTLSTTGTTLILLRRRAAWCTCECTTSIVLTSARVANAGAPGMELAVEGSDRRSDLGRRVYPVTTELLLTCPTVCDANNNKSGAGVFAVCGFRGGEVPLRGGVL